MPSGIHINARIQQNDVLQRDDIMLFTSTVSGSNVVGDLRSNFSSSGRDILTSSLSGNEETAVSLMAAGQLKEACL